MVLTVSRRKIVSIGGNSILPTSRPTDYGNYKPQVGITAGLLNESILTDYNSSSATTVTLANGTTISNSIIYGDIRPPSSHTLNIILNNCLLVGGTQIPSTNDGVLNCNAVRSGTGKIILIDCEIRPQVPALNRDCIRGHRWEAYRCYIHDGIDNIGTFADTSSDGGNANVVMAGCWAENMRYGHPDYNNGVSGATEHSDGTHNDVIQHHGGNNTIYRGNVLNATSTPLPSATDVGTNHIRFIEPMSGNGILVAKEGAAITGDASIFIDRNWFYGGATSQLLVQTDTSCQIRGNRFHHATRSNHWIRVENTRLLPGLTNADGSLNNTDNVWDDAPNLGSPLTFSDGIIQDPA